jgi:hypothetical protein
MTFNGRWMAFCLGLSIVATGSAVVLSGEDNLYPMLPDSSLTPGAVSDTSAAVICQPGYALAHRPDEEQSLFLKRANLDRYNVSRSSISDVELDALIPICLGGNHYDQRNLWPQPWRGQWNAKVKDDLEKRVCREDCALRDDAQVARDQKAFAANWIALWKERMK